MPFHYSEVVQFLTNLIVSSASSFIIINGVQYGYHWLCHSRYTISGLEEIIKWAKAGHARHHAAYGREYSFKASPEEICAGHLVYELPEALTMLLASLMFTFLLAWLKIPGWWGSFYGIYRAAYLAVRALRIANSFDTFIFESPMHIPPALNSDGAVFFPVPPAHWTVNAAFHVRHHDTDALAYYSADFAWFDMAFKTAYSFNGLTLAFCYAEGSADLAKGLAEALPVSRQRIALMPQ
jgi:hypothetical protein